MARLAVSMIGAGHIHAPGYLKILAGRDDVDLIGVYDVDPDRARAMAEQCGTVAASERQCLEWSAAVVVCSEPTRQLALVQAAVDAGRPTLCEKPLGTTNAEAHTLRELGDRVPVSVAFPVRYHHAAVRLRDMVAAGAIGAVPAVWATNRNSFPGGWFADPSLAGGGCLLDHVVHVADLIRWIWRTEFTTVRAEAGNLHNRGLQMEDTASVLVECSNGLIATIDPSMSRPKGMPGALDLTMDVWGELGTATIDVFADRVDAVDSKGFVRRRHVGEDMDAAMIDDWIDSVHTGAAAPVPARDGFAATMLALAARTAATTHRMVELSS